MNKFSIGEVAIIHGLVDDEIYQHAKYNGIEVTILKCVGLITYTTGDLVAYEISSPELWDNATVAEPMLRKKKPPEEDINWVEKLGLDKLKEIEHA